ncbi:MAG: hypothetical protein KGJ84_04200 [Elusimicrobia bacterium]|nr:hypothetical protein [Elusimicrobiota bacterium]
MFYSIDGTRSVQIVGAAKDPYLYDLTVADPSGADEKTGGDGTPLRLAAGCRRTLRRPRR